MKIHRFITKFNILGNVVKIDDKEIVNQICKVLKLKVGEQVILGNGEMEEILMDIKDINRYYVEGRILKKHRNENEADIYGILYCAVLKKENFELVVQKATEIGISEIVPLITERTVKLNLNYERLGKIIKEASEQSGRGKLPVLRQAMKFEEAVEVAKKNDFNLFLDASGSQLKNFKLKNLKTISVWVGPEGGWTDSEMENVKSKIKEGRFEIVSLGKTTLRGETAAIVGSWTILT